MLDVIAQLVVMLLAAEPAAALAPAPDEITKPLWVYQPAAFELSCHFPDRALRSGVLVGGAVLHCRATPAGGLSECTVVEERPQTWQFGAAAKEASSAYKLQPLDAAGSPVAGRPITVTIRLAFDTKGPMPDMTTCRRYLH
jgi:hypothetical protein